MASTKDMRSNYKSEPIPENGAGYFYEYPSIAPTPGLAKVRVLPCSWVGAFFYSIIQPIQPDKSEVSKISLLFSMGYIAYTTYTTFFFNFMYILLYIRVSNIVFEKKVG